MIRILDIDNWREVTATMRKNKLRTTLTGLGVFLGIVILLLMIGFGRSLEKGVKRRMAGFATNAVFVWGQRTTKPYAGFPLGRQIEYDNRDIDALARLPGVLHVAPRAQRGGFMQGSNVRYGTKTGAFQVSGDYPAFQYVQTPVMRAGRFLNQRDLDDSRKVAVIGESVAEQLYEGADPIGTYVEANGVYFQVVGVFGTLQTGQQADRIVNTIHIPFTTFQRAFNYNDRVGFFAIVGQPGVHGEELEAQIKTTLKQRHHVAREDDSAIGAWNTSKEFGKMNMLFFLINLVMWVAGTMCLLAGVVGVSNIMLITVRERTKEIGVRKALGATPASVVRMIVSEATVLTVIFGYLGVVAGVVLLELAGKVLEKLPDLPFAPPDPNLTIALSAAGVIVVFGSLAGVLPAYYAAKISPIEALRTE
ncbi:MAG: ABC transporter permease [Myxococcales bacterium]|nr:ABC transporter permease [Myxococcales bacterium]